MQEVKANEAYGPPYIWELSIMESCTNSVTNDILTCWFSQPNRENFASEVCSIFFVETNTFSDPIPVSNVTSRRIEDDAALSVICFNDSYLVPHEVIPDRVPSGMWRYMHY